MGSDEAPGCSRDAVAADNASSHQRTHRRGMTKQAELNMGLAQSSQDEEARLLNALLADEYLLYTKTRKYQLWHWLVMRSGDPASKGRSCLGWLWPSGSLLADKSRAASLAGFHQSSKLEPSTGRALCAIRSKKFQVLRLPSSSRCMELFGNQHGEGSTSRACDDSAT